MTSGHAITTETSTARVQVVVAGVTLADTCFFAERVDHITVDDAPIARPETPWSISAAV